jgi:hypothetical protein
MYMAITHGRQAPGQATSMEAGAPNYLVLVPARAGARDGCIWHWSSNPTKLVSLPVRVLTGRPNQPEQPIWGEHFLDTADLIEAVRQGDKDEVEGMIREQLDDEKLAGRAIENPAAYICAQLASGLSGAQFVIWWRDHEQRLDVGIYCANPRAAAYAHLFAYGAEPFPVGKCPECGKRFGRSRWHPETYCSTRCRNTHNVRLSRERRRRMQKKARRGKSSRRGK